MDFGTAGDILRRRWRTVAIALAAGALLTVALVARIGVTYSAQGSLILLPPGTATAEGSGAGLNPYTSFDSSLNVTADAVVAVMNGGETVDRLKAQGVNTFSLVRRANSPIIDLSVDGKSSLAAVNGARTVLNMVTSELSQRQQAAGAGNDALVKADVLVAPDQAQAQTGGRLRAGAATIALVLALAISLAFVQEQLSGSGIKWRRRATATTDTEDDDKADATDGPGTSEDDDNDVAPELAPVKVVAEVPARTVAAVHDRDTPGQADEPPAPVRPERPEPIRTPAATGERRTLTRAHHSDGSVVAASTELLQSSHSYIAATTEGHTESMASEWPA